VRDWLAAAPVAHFGETSARVDGRLHCVHAASTSGLNFVLRACRAGQGDDGRRRGAAGVVGVAVHDGWSPYWRYEDVRDPPCGANPLRELEGVAEEPGQGWAAGMAELLLDVKLVADRARTVGADRVDEQARARWTRTGAQDSWRSGHLSV
jgi:transposase